MDRSTSTNPTVDRRRIDPRVPGCRRSTPMIHCVSPRTALGASDGRFTVSNDVAGDRLSRQPRTIGQICASRVGGLVEVGDGQRDSPQAGDELLAEQFGVPPDALRQVSICLGELDFRATGVVSAAQAQITARGPYGVRCAGWSVRRWPESFVSQLAAAALLGTKELFRGAATIHLRTFPCDPTGSGFDTSSSGRSWSWVCLMVFLSYPIGGVDDGGDLVVASTVMEMN